MSRSGPARTSHRVGGWPAPTPATPACRTTGSWMWSWWSPSCSPTASIRAAAPARCACGPATAISSSRSATAAYSPIRLPAPSRPSRPNPRPRSAARQPPRRPRSSAYRQRRHNPARPFPDLKRQRAVVDDVRAGRYGPLTRRHAPHGPSRGPAGDRCATQGHAEADHADARSRRCRVAHQNASKPVDQRRFNRIRPVNSRPKPLPGTPGTASIELSEVAP